MLVGEACNRDVVVVEKEDSILEATQLMREHHVGSVIIVEKPDGERVPLGVLTDRDIAIELVATEVDLNSITVGDATTEEVLTLNEHDGIMEAIQRMRNGGFRRAPVVNEHGGLVGVLALDDIIELIAEQLLDVVHLMSRGQRRERRTRP